MRFLFDFTQFVNTSIIMTFLNIWRFTHSMHASFTSGDPASSTDSPSPLTPFAYLGMAGGTIWQTEDLPGGERSVKEKGIFNMSNLFKCVFIDYHLFFINNYQSMSSIKILRHLLFLLIFSIILTADFTLILVTHKFVCCLPHL